MVDGPTLRLATRDDEEGINALMKASTRDLFPAFYADGVPLACVSMEKPVA
jgi:hypothetical protein